MIKTRIAVLAAALSFTAVVACFAANPHMGTWKLNEAKSKLVPGMGKNTTVTYAEQKDKIKITVEGVDKDGKPTHSVWVGQFDGKAYPVKGNLPYNSVAYRVVNDRTNDIAAKIVEQRISREEEQVAFVASCEAMLERFYGAILFAQRRVSEGEGVLRNLCGLRHFIQAREQFSRFIRLSISGITLDEHGHGIRIMVQLDRFLKFRDRLFESSL